MYNQTVCGPGSPPSPQTLGAWGLETRPGTQEDGSGPGEQYRPGKLETDPVSTLDNRFGILTQEDETPVEEPAEREGTESGFNSRHSRRGKVSGHGEADPGRGSWGRTTEPVANQTDPSIDARSYGI